MAADKPQRHKTSITAVITIPGYKIIDILGRGGMAIVYKALQESVGRTVAIKVLAPNHNDDTFTERFLREAQIISNLTHPNIITVFDAGVIKSHHYMSMEYIAGKTLRDARDDLTRKQKVNIIKQIALALDYIGKKTYVHRDIKPENIMLHEDGRAVLMDFGIARGDDSKRGLTLTGKAIGTPYYMSPEQTKGIKVDSRSDIYSLGVVLFQALTGFVPYEGNSFVDIGMKHITQAIPILPKGLEAYQFIINTALSKDPEHRYQTAAELINALNKVPLTELDKIDLKAAVINNKSVDYDAATVMDTDVVEQDKTPLKNTTASKEKIRARKKITGTILHQKISVGSKIDAVKDSLVKTLKRRRRLLLLLLLTLSTAAVYYNRKTIEPYWVSYAVPVLNEYLPSSVKQKFGILDYLEKTAKPKNIKKEIHKKENFVVNNATIVLFDINSFLSKKGKVKTISDEDISRFYLSDQTEILLLENIDVNPENATKLITYYTALLTNDVLSEKARTGILKLRIWFIRTIKKSIRSDDFSQGKILLGILKENFPDIINNTRFKRFEKTLSQKESINTHLKLAKEYFDKKHYIEPLSENALEELLAVFDVDKENLKARELKRKIVDIFVNQVKNLQAEKLYGSAIVSAESGLKISSNDAFLKSSHKNLKKLFKIQQQVNQYLLLAQSQMNKENFVTPESNNAYKIYKSIFVLDENNKKAIAALLKIELNLVKQANQAIRSNNISNAKLILQLLEQYYPDSTHLKQTQTRLAEAIESKKPSITTLYFSDVVKASLNEMRNVKIQSGNTLYIGFKYINFPKLASYLLVNLLDHSAINKLLYKTVKLEGKKGEQIMLINIPGTGLQAGHYYIEMKFGKKSLIKKSFRIYSSSSHEITSP